MAASGRRWRIFTPETTLFGHGMPWDIAEMEFYTSSNCVGHKIPTPPITLTNPSSSNYYLGSGSVDDQYHPSNVFDDDINSVWGGRPGNGAYYIEIEYNVAIQVNCVRVVQPTVQFTPSEFWIQYLENDIWKNAFEYAGPYSYSTILVIPSQVPSLIPSRYSSLSPSKHPSGLPSQRPTHRFSNIALNKPATQSTYCSQWPGPASYGVDGVASLHTHTCWEKDPWWQVDLTQEYLISEVHITNRVDCCSERLDNFITDFFDVHGDVTSIFFEGSVGLGEQVSLIIPDNFYVRSVRIRLEGDGRLLSLGEVQIIGCTYCGSPSNEPSVYPSFDPSTFPSTPPTTDPSLIPSYIPTSDPSILPSTVPTNALSMMPSYKPSPGPSRLPSQRPTHRFSNIAVNKPATQSTHCSQWPGPASYGVDGVAST